MTIVLIKEHKILIDEEDYDIFLSHTWTPSISKKGIKKKIYFVTGFNKKTTYLHRLIAKTPTGLICDHKDGNTLNCTRDNLRSVDVFQNKLNVSKRTISYSKYKGVYKRQIPRLNPYYSLIQRKGHPRIYLGSFKTEEAAADAYNSKMKELYGEYFDPQTT